MTLVHLTKQFCSSLSFATCILGIATYASPAFADAPTSLGSFTLLNQSASAGNGMVIAYGVSSEGGGLLTYWGGTPIQVLSVGNSQYELAETIGGRCLTVTGSSVTTATCTAAAAQLFSLSSRADATYQIQSSTGSCLNALGAFSVVNAQGCNGSASQGWNFSGPSPLSLADTTTTSTATTTPTTTASTPSSTATSTATAAGSLGTFAVLNTSATAGNSLIDAYGVSSEGNTFGTYWGPVKDIQILSMGNSQYELVETMGNRCLTMSNALVTMAKCAGSTTQLFALNQQASGSYQVQSTAGTCLNASGAFAPVTGAACDSSTAQSWSIPDLSLGASSSTATTSTTTATSTSTSTPASTSTATSTASTGTNASTTSNVVNSAAVPAGYHLTFDDEFSSLNISDTNGAGTKWYTHTVQCCLQDTSSPLTPGYMAGIGDGDGKNPYSLVAGGLDIRLQKTNGAWYSGVLSTVDGNGSGFAQKYGYFEMKAKFPNAVGTWPAFWLLNSAALSQGATPGEIDIVEAYMQFPTYITTTLHDWGNFTAIGPQITAVANTTTDFHTYGMLWTASTITFYFDSTPYWTLPTPPLMNQPYYPIIDLGLGGNWPTLFTPQQNDMIVQYVRVYSN